VDKRSRYIIEPVINGLSDHDAPILQFINLTPPIDNSKPIPTRNINEQSVTKFLSLLSWQLWEEVFEENNKNVNDMFNQFLNTYLRYYNASFLKTYVNTKHSHNAWITKGIIISSKRKKELFTLSRISNNYNLKLYYKKYCSILTKVICNAKKLHCNNIILQSKNKMKTTWQIINRERRISQPDISIPKLEMHNSTITNQQVLANTFNRYFISVADNIKDDINNKANTSKMNPINYLLNYYNNPFPRLNWQYASTYEIGKIINSLKPINTTGYDDISNRIIKLSAPYIISPLTYTCNASLSTGIFPDRLKCAIVKPIHKSGSKHEISNYRPISLLPAFSKIFEKVIYNRLYKHFEINSILARERFGFRSQHSTEQAASSPINSILTAMNSNHIVGGIFCDLRKAFDCVKHKILLDKLIFYGTGGKFKSLIESYLNNRFQKVTIGKNVLNNNSSDWVKIKCGVPRINTRSAPMFSLHK